MNILKDNIVLVGVLAVLGLGITATTVTASTSGWGVDNAPPPDRRPSTARHRHGHHYWIFYGSRHRGVRSGGRYGGGGFRGGK